MIILHVGACRGRNGCGGLECKRKHQLLKPAAVMYINTLVLDVSAAVEILKCQGFAVF